MRVALLHARQQEFQDFGAVLGDLGGAGLEGGGDGLVVVVDIFFEVTSVLYVCE